MSDQLHQVETITAKTTEAVGFTYQESLLFINGKVLRLFRPHNTTNLYAGLREYLLCLTGCKGSIEFLVDVLKEYLHQTKCQVLFLSNHIEFMLPVSQFIPVLIILHAVMECDEKERLPFDWKQANAADLYIEYVDAVQSSLQEACRRRDVKCKVYNPSTTSTEQERRSYWVYQRFIGMIQSERQAQRNGQPYTLNLLR